MMSTLSEYVIKRKNSYTSFYSKFIEECFQIDEEFISCIDHFFKSRKWLPRTFEDEKELKVDQCAYLLQFGVQDAWLGEESFRTSVLECSKLEKICGKERINVVCMGSQSLIATLGICKVIDEYAKKFHFENDSLTQVQIFIIDKSSEWKMFCERIVRAAKKEYPNLKLKLDFLKVDMMIEFSDTAKLRIERSHIVAMVNYLPKQNSEDDVKKIRKKILKDMRRNAVLFYLNCETKTKLMENSKSFYRIDTSMPIRYLTNEDVILHHQTAYEFLSPINMHRFKKIKPMTLSTWINNPDIKNKLEDEAKELKHIVNPVHSDKFYKAKRSSNTKRGDSKETFKLVGKYALMDLEKKNKDNSHRREAKEAAASRYASFDD